MIKQLAATLAVAILSSLNIGLARAAGAPAGSLIANGNFETDADGNKQLDGWPMKENASWETEEGDTLRSSMSIGPIEIRSAERCTALYVVLPVFRSGKIKTVARPATCESGAFDFATSSMIAASYCSGPSITRAGRFSCAMRVASRTFSTSLPAPDVPVE